jgi:hypothetical protein
VDQRPAGGNQGRPLRQGLADHPQVPQSEPASASVIVSAAILPERHELHCQARERNPRRWSGATRNWTPIEVVTLNPERESVVKTHSGSLDEQTMAARMRRQLL